MCGRLNRNINFPRPYVWDEQGELVKASNAGQLLRLIAAIREKRGGDLAPGWQERVGNKVCEADYMSSCCSDGPVGATRQITAADVKRFFSTVSAWIASGGSLVDPETSELRSSVCASCPQNVRVRGCMGCSGVVPKLLKLLKGASTTHDHQLQGCNVCGCQLKAKVHLPSDVMVDGTEAQDFPEHCWIRKELNQ